MMIHRPLHSRAIARRRGAVTVEFAVSLSVLLLIVFAGFEIARLNMVRHAVGNASYDAARHAMVPGATAAEAQQCALKVLSDLGVSGAAVVITPTPLNDQAPLITVTVTVPMAANSWIVPLFSPNKVFTNTVRLVTERPPSVQMRGLTTAR